MYIILCTYECTQACVYVCMYVYIHNYVNVGVYTCNTLYKYKLTIFVPQVVPEAAGVPILKHEFPVVDVPQRNIEHMSCMKARNAI